MSEGLMGQAIESYFKVRGKEPSSERRMDYGKLGFAGEMEYQLRFGDVAEKAEAREELLRITGAMRSGGGLGVLDQQVVGLMRGVDVKTATPNDVLDKFAQNAASIAGEIRRTLEVGGVKDEDVLEAGPWAVLRAGERAAVKLMAVQEDPRAGEFLEASKPLAGASDIEAPQKEYDVPDWAQVVGGAVLAEVVDALQERRDRATQGQVAQEVLQTELSSFALIQQELEDLVDNPNPGRERELIGTRARVLAGAKRAGVLDSIQKDVLVAQNSANMDFQQAYEVIRDMEGVQYETQLRGQGVLRPEWEGIVDHYRLGVLRNMEVAMLEETASRGQAVDRTRLERLRRERSLLGWGNPPPDIRAMAKKHLDAQGEERRRAEEKRRLEDEARQRIDAEKRAGQQRQEQTEELKRQSQRLRELQERMENLRRGGEDEAAKDVAREIAGLRRDMAGRAEPQPALTAESLTMPNPDAIETVLLDRLREGKWKAGKVGAMELSDATSVYDAITKLDGATDLLVREKARMLRAMAGLITDIGSEGRNEPNAHIRNTLTREDQVELEKREGVIASWKKLMEVAGFNFGTVQGEDIWNLWENNDPQLVQIIDRTRTLGVSFPEQVRRQEYAHLFVNENGSPKTFWQLKSEDMVDSNGRKGYVSMETETMALQMGKRVDDPEVKRAVMISMGLLKHSRVLEMFATDYDHPWINVEWYRLMHPAEYFRKRAVANHDSVSEAPLASYVKMHRVDFPTRDGVTGKYGAGALVEGTNYRYHGVFFPPDWLKSWIFAPDVMRKVGDVRMTMWDYLGRGEAPVLEKFNAKNIWEVENLRRGAAVELDNLIYKKTDKINTGKGEPWADMIASQVAGIVKKMGVVNKYVAVDVEREGDLSPLEARLPQIHRILRVATMARIGMGMDRGRLAVLEDKAFVIGTAMEQLDDAHKFTNTQKFVDDDGRDLPDLPIDMEDKPFLGWIKSAGQPIPPPTKRLEVKGVGVTLEDPNYPERLVLGWLRKDVLAQRVMRILAQGLSDAGSLEKIRNLNNRRRHMGSWYGGLGTHSNRTWSERQKLASSDKAGYQRVYGKINSLNFG